MENEKKAGRLQQMSDEMKQHIAQLKAELGNDMERKPSENNVAKEVRNKVLASTLRRHLEKKPRNSIINVKADTSEELERCDMTENLSHSIADKTKDIQKTTPVPGKPATSQACHSAPSKHVPTMDAHEKPDDLDSLSANHFQSSENLSTSQPTDQPVPLLSSTNDKLVGSVGECSVQGKSEHCDSPSETSTSNSPRSVPEGGEDGIPVRYLQMSTASPRTSRKKRGSKLNRRSLSQDRILDMNTTPRSEISHYEELEGRLGELQEQCDLLAEENIKIKRQQRSKAEEKIANLKKRNGELANIARRLEEKARSLQEQNVKKTNDMASLTRDIQQLKRTHQRHKSRCEAEHLRNVSEKEDELVAVQAQLEDLKKALKQSRRVKFKGKESSEDQEVLQQAQKEMLHLQKLASAASSKVIVRSLSTPVTARQKILEESNRNLRRQVTTLEGSIQELEAKLGQSGEVDDHLKVIEEEKNDLRSEVEGQKGKILSLESELQQSKIEASDVSIQLKDLKHIYLQIQDDYSTVHDQLAVAIKERDQAVSKCKEHASKSAQMESTIRTLLEEKQSYTNMQSRHQEALAVQQAEMAGINDSHSHVVKEYKTTLENLQAKISRLEQQCEEQDVSNKSLKAQLSALVKWSQKGGGEGIAENTNLNNNNVSGHQVGITPVSPPVPRFTTSGAASAFRKPKVTSLELRHMSASSASSASKQVMDQDDTEAEDFEDEEPPPPTNGMGNPLAAHEPHSTAELRVFIAKYSYNPYDGPNEHPDTELALVAGDYVYVHGDMDVDGFFQGELMNGERGLVPSNFLEPVHDVPQANSVIGPGSNALLSSDDVIRPKSQRAGSLRGSTRSNSKLRSSESNASRSLCSMSSAESRDQLTLSSEEEGLSHSSVLPFPRKLRVDKKLSHSLIIGWISPHLGDDDIVDEYHVLVDGCLATVVNGSKSKAVVERIYHDKNCYSISVCAVTERGRSEPGHCSIRYGITNGKPVVIPHLRVEHVTTGGARVAWDAVNSNQTCSVCVGEINEENQHLDKLTNYHRQILVPCPMFRQTISGLKPKTTYEVMVKCKGTKNEPDAVSKPVRFTTPTLGPPDPPLSVQVEENLSGSVESLLVSWLPVTLKENGLSNGVPVSGYSIFINNTLLSTTEPSTSDHCSVSWKTLSEHVVRVLASDPSYQPRVVNKNGNKVFLPSMFITVKSQSSGGQTSDYSTPYYLHRTLVKRLAPSDSKQSLQNHSSATSGGPFARGKALSNSVGPRSTKSNPPVVPSIEITLDTSSEDDLSSHHESNLNSSSNRRRTQSADHPPGARKRDRNEDDPSREYFNHKSKENRSKSTSNLRYKNYEESDSEEHSSSTSDSYKRFPRESHGSPSRSQSRVKSSDRQPPTPRKRTIAYRSSNSPSSLHGDDHVATDGSWHSNLSDVDHPHVRSSPLSRRLHQHHMRLRNPSSQSGGSASEIDAGDDSRVSLFVALYDYDPYTMSPNTDMLEEELPFSEGQLLKVYGQKDQDGFYYGEMQNGKTGHIPCNMVSEVQVDDFTMLEELFERGHLPSATPDGSKDSGVHPGESPAPRASSSGQGRMCVALFDYDPKESSPNIDAEVELSFRRGDLILIRGQMDEDGFFKGELNGQKGLVPSNFLEDVTSEQVATLHRPNSTRTTVATVSTNTMTDASIPVKLPEAPSSSTNFKDLPSVASNSSNPSSHASDSPKKKGIISKGKKFFKKFGANDGKGKK